MKSSLLKVRLESWNNHNQSFWFQWGNYVNSEQIWFYLQKFNLFFVNDTIHKIIVKEFGHLMLLSKCNDDNHAHSSIAFSSDQIVTLSWNN
jgi:hypothetical protein